jgi:hypothetical protein
VDQLRVKLTAGTHAVRCLSLSRKVFRWYNRLLQDADR